MKKCPYCAEKIQDDAKVCRYCKRDLPLVVEAEAVPAAPVDVDGAAIAAEEAKPRKRSIALLVWLILISINIFCVAGVMIFTTDVVNDALAKGYVDRTYMTSIVVITLVFIGIYLGALIPSWLLWRTKRNKLAFWLSLVILLPTILAPLCSLTMILG